VSITEVAERLGVSRPTARDRLRRRLVPGLVEHCGMPRVDRQVFEKWLASKSTW